MADTTEERGGEGRRRRHHRHKRRRGDDEGHGEGKPSRSRGSHSHSRRHSRRSRREEVQEQAGHIAKVLQETGRVVGYDDEENPFGDENLSQAFVWHKKIEKQLEGGATERAFSAEEVRQRHEERLKEIEQVKKRRVEREKELARKQEELELPEHFQEHWEILDSRYLVFPRSRRMSESSISNNSTNKAHSFNICVT